MPSHVRLRIDLAPGCSIGPGKIELLEHIEHCGSLSQAARELGMSYRRAWLLIDDLNRSLSEPVVTSATGGKHGGGAQLTAAGRALARSYRGFERRAESLATRAFAAFTASGVNTNRKSVRGRKAKRVVRTRR